MASYRVCEMLNLLIVVYLTHNIHILLIIIVLKYLILWILCEPTPLLISRYIYTQPSKRVWNSLYVMFSEYKQHNCPVLSNYRSKQVITSVSHSLNMHHIHYMLMQMFGKVHVSKMYLLATEMCFRMIGGRKRTEDGKRLVDGSKTKWKQKGKWRNVKSNLINSWVGCIYFIYKIFNVFFAVISLSFFSTSS